MFALLLAGGLAAASPGPIQTHRFAQGDFVSPQAACQAHVTELAKTPPKAARLRRLGDLPKANWEIAVLRQVDGCPAPVVIRYSAEGDGSFASDGK